MRPKGNDEESKDGCDNSDDEGSDTTLFGTDDLANERQVAGWVWVVQGLLQLGWGGG